MKKTILILNSYYLPAKKYGGPTTSIANLIEACGDDFDIKLIVRNHDYGSKEVFPDILSGWNKVGKANVIYLPDKEFNLKNFKKWLIELKPALVYGGELYSLIGLKIIKITNSMNIPLIFTARGQLNYNALRHKSYKKLPYIFCLRMLNIFKKTYFHATCEQEKLGIENYLRIDENKIFSIENMPRFANNELNKKKDCRVLKIVSIARICPIKNILFAIKVVNLLNVETIFDIYGPLEDYNYWNLCENEIKKAPSNIHINYCGHLNSDQVCTTLEKYDCFLFPTLSENYGHSIVEAMISGCPVVISQGTTPWDSVNNNGGFTANLGYIQNFADVLTKIAKMSEDEYSELLAKTNQYIKNKINYKEVKNKYMQMFDRVVLGRE